MSFTLMLRCTSVTLNYPVLKSGKAFIYAYLQKSKHHNFSCISYGILNLGHTNVHLHIYKKIINYILDLLYLESTKDYDQEKG